VHDEINKTNQQTLNDFLEKKTLFYSEININFMKIAWEIVRLYTKPKYVIHLVGTNGKGSTGRILAAYLHKKGFKTLHYSSPHILKFNERIWIDGEDVSDEELNKNHKILQSILSDFLLLKLTYFEYTTLLALLISHDVDYLVLEAGLGGEFDATSVIKNDLTIVTTIDFDHQEFLGNTIEAIATTKIVSADNTIILAKQVHDEVHDIAYKIAKQKKLHCFTTNDFKYSRKTYNIFPQTFLNQNLLSVLAVLEHLKIEINFDCFKDIQIKGRCQKIAPNITIDVGHNPLGANVIAKEFENKKVLLVYNSLKDKDYKQVLAILKPIIKHLYVIHIDDQRALDVHELESTLKELEISYSEFNSILPFHNQETLVFGSFKVVEEFLKIYEK
jgi:dihydrofolate synthase / folylpolyglutamate synthase